MHPVKLVLLAAACLVPCTMAAQAAAKARAVPPARMAAERARTDTAVRRLETTVNSTLNACRRARGLQQRCSCYAQVQRLQSDVGRERRRVSNVHETRFMVAKESLRDQNEDKKFWFMKLKQLNAMGEALSDYLKELTGHTTRLGLKSAGEEPVSPARCRGVGGRQVPASRAPLRVAPGLAGRGAQQDIMALIQAVLKESYGDNVQTLRDHAARVKHHNEMKRKLREALRQARGHVRASGHPCGPGAPPEIRELCDGIARLERRERELDLQQRRLRRPGR